jgi:hypothetical protein
MAKTTYEWKINKLECLPNEQKIVSKVHWSLSAKRGDYNCDCFGEIQLDYEEDSELIEYSELDEKIVLNWVKSELHGTVNDEVHLKSVLSERLNELELESLKTQGLPWGSDL